MKVFVGILIATLIFSIIYSMYMVAHRKFFAGAIMQGFVGERLPKLLVMCMCTIATWFWSTIMLLMVIAIVRLIWYITKGFLTKN